MTTMPPQDQPTPLEGIGSDPRLSAVTTMVPAASREDSILKFYRSSSLDYKAHYGYGIFEFQCYCVIT